MLGLTSEFWRGRSVFLTGHTGFKGSWLTLWLAHLGAKVHGYALGEPTQPSIYSVANVNSCLVSSTIGDVRDLVRLTDALRVADPSLVIHMAAQPLVKESYRDPVTTFSTNVVGTVNVIEAARGIDAVKAVINVTTDKCYENHNEGSPFSEDSRLGGEDPYSSSKACAELATSAFRASFLSGSGMQLASVRAGNVIGGGDWARDRLVPDFLRSVEANETLAVRSPDSIRPWQHVLEPLSGYLILGERLLSDTDGFAEAWNFGPEESDVRPVSWVVEFLSNEIPDARWQIDTTSQPQEASVLKLDCSKAKARLGWTPRWSLDTALAKTLEWHEAWWENQSMKEVSLQQIETYLKA